MDLHIIFQIAYFSHFVLTDVYAYTICVLQNVIFIFINRTYDLSLGEKKNIRIVLFIYLFNFQMCIE